jgi:hypothetical protein
MAHWGGGEKIMETLRNSGVEFIYVGYTERTAIGNAEICLPTEKHDIGEVL